MRPRQNFHLFTRYRIEWNVGCMCRAGFAKHRLETVAACLLEVNMVQQQIGQGWGVRAGCDAFERFTVVEHCGTEVRQHFIREVQL